MFAVNRGQLREDTPECSIPGRGENLVMIGSNCTSSCRAAKNEQLHEGLGDTTRSTPLAVRRADCPQ